MKSKVLLAVVVLSLFALSGCLLQQPHDPLLMRSNRPLKAQIVQAVLEIRVSKVEKTGSRINESPSMVAPNRIATATVIKILAGNWKGPTRIKIVYDKDTIVLSAGRFLLYVDSNSRWCNLRATQSTGPLLRRTAKQAIGKPVPWP